MRALQNLTLQISNEHVNIFQYSYVSQSQLPKTTHIIFFAWVIGNRYINTFKNRKTGSL